MGKKLIIYNMHIALYMHNTRTCAHTHTHTHTRTHTHPHTHAHTCTYAHTHIRTHACMNTHTYKLYNFLADRACPAENDTNYEIPWPSVGANMTATVPCTNAAGRV